MCRPSQFNDKQIEQINIIYNSGETMQNIAKMYNVAFQTIQKNIKNPRKPSRQAKI